MRVAVVGAGWSGLAAAVQLAAAGMKPEVFEAARQAGGRARRVVLEGIDLDNGQHILLGAYARTLEIMRMVGADPDRLLRRLPLELVYPGRFALRAPRWLPAPLHLAAGLLTATGLPWRDKLAAARMMRALQAGGFQISPDISVDDFLCRHRQPDAVRRYLWEPLCIAALNTAHSDASAQVFANILRDAFMHSRRDSDLLLPRTDLGAAFPDPAIAYIRSVGGSVHLGASVDAIRTRGNALELDAGQTGGRIFDSVVCAVPPSRAAALLPPAAVGAQALQRRLLAFEFEPIVTCYLQYAATVHLPHPMIGLDGPVGQWAFDRGALGGPGGLIAVVVSAAGKLRDLGAAALAATIHDELARLLPGLQPFAWQRVITEKRATFRCTPALVRPGVETTLPGLFLAGDHVAGDYPATIEGAVRSGIAAAHAAIKRAVDAGGPATC